MIYGVQYYRPPFPMDRYWAQDAAKVKAVGLESIQFWVTWAWVEAAPGVYDFSDYDRLIQEAQKNGLKVVLSVSAELQPYWIHRVIPDSRMVDNMGREVVSSNRGESNQGLTPGGCTDHPEVYRRMREFFVRLADHYKDNGTVIAWDCWNEYRWEVNSDGLVCYCPHTLKAFRDWLLERHGSLEGINKAWRRKYCHIEDVLPGKLPGRPYTEMMEWQAFIQWRQGQLMKMRTEAIRSVDKKHIVSAHGPTPTPMCVWGSETPGVPGGVTQTAIHRGNDWEMVQYLDTLGSSYYPYFQTPRLEDFGVRLEMTRSSAGDKPVWISELMSGGTSGFANVRLDERLQQLWVWTAIARGVKGIIFWSWRDEVFGGEAASNGMSGADGNAEGRFAAIADTGRFLYENEALFEAYRPDAAKVGVMFDPNTYWLEWSGRGKCPHAMNSLFGHLRALERSHIPYDVLESEHLRPLEQYALIVLPGRMVVPAPAAQRLAKWVKAGGTLLVESEIDAFDDKGFFRYVGADRPFAWEMGVAEVGNRQAAGEAMALDLEGERFFLRGDDHLTPYACDQNGAKTQVLAKSIGSQPTAVLNRVGGGRVYALGSWLGEKYFDEIYPNFEDFIAKVADLAGARHPLGVCAPAQVQWRTGLSAGRRLLFMVNHGQACRVTVASGGPLSAGAAPCDLRTGRTLTYQEDGWALYLDRDGYAVIALE